MSSAAPSVLELAEMQSPAGKMQSPVGEMQSAAGRQAQGSSPLDGDGGGDGGKGGGDGGGGCGRACQSDDSLGSVSPPSTATDEESAISGRGIMLNYVLIKSWLGTGPYYF